MQILIVVEKGVDSLKPVESGTAEGPQLVPLPCARDHCLQGKDICTWLKTILGLLQLVAHC